MKAINQNKNNYGCISEKMLLNYVQGSLGTKEQHIVESHLLDCELCSDALEGLLLIKNNSNTTEMVASLKHEINQRLIKDKKPRPIAFHWWQLAAILVIIIISAGSYFIINQASKEAQNTIAQNESLSSKKQETENIEEHTREEVKAIAKVEQSDNLIKHPASKPESQIDKKAGNLTAADEPLVKEEIALSTKVTSDESDRQKSKTALAKESDVPMVSEDAPTNTRLYKDYQNVMETTEMNETGNAKSISKLPSANQNSSFDKSFNEGLKLYNEKNYAKALRNFQKSTPDIKVDFYSAVCHFYLKNYTQCIALMDKAAANTRVSFYPEALWYKANALIELKEIEKAKTVLNQLILLESRFKPDAQQLLNNL